MISNQTKKRQRVSAAFAALLLLGTAALPAVTAVSEICFIVYQMADNDLEWFINEDYLEITQAPGLKENNVHTWMYWDGVEDIVDYTGDGEVDTGSIYETYDHSLSDMRIDAVLKGEVNSDDPSVVCDFVAHALQDCVSKGATEYFVLFSSHGGGYRGFGGDWNKRRRLVLGNDGLVAALKCALSSVPSAPSKFDVIAFDACLMQSYLAARDYSKVAKFFLASEANEPGHGWAYNRIRADDVESSLSLAMRLHETFLSNPGDGSWGGLHQTPKTLALVEMSSFGVFSENFEALATELTRLLEASNDAEFSATLQRARASSKAFEGYLDNPGSKNPSGLDIGSFLATFTRMCEPSQSSQLRILLDEALASYDSMFVARGTGPGTSKSATGMHITWPTKKSYDEDWVTWNSEFFYYIDDGDTSYAWIEFLVAYISYPTPPFTEGSVCAKTIMSTVEPTFEGQLLLNPEMSETEHGVEVKSEITVETDIVFAEYGFDGTYLFEEGTRRKLMQTFQRSKMQRAYTRVGKRRAHKRGRALLDGRKRVVQSYLDYVIIFGGSLEGKYEGPTFSATWFSPWLYLLGEGQDIFPFSYAFDGGDGIRSMPVIYFPKDVPISSTVLPYASLIEEALSMGGVYGELEFAVDPSTGDILTPLTLYTNENSEGASPISETPRSALGTISPIMYTEISVGGEVDFLDMVGGAIFEWKEESSLVPLKFDAARLYDYMVIDLYAYDLDKNKTDVGGFDWYGFDIDLTSGASEPVVDPTSPPGQGTSPSNAPGNTPPGVEPVGDPISPQRHGPTPNDAPEDTSPDIAQSSGSGSSKGCNLTPNLLLRCAAHVLVCMFLFLFL